ncbi:MAG TPA: pyridoxal phosphate-dependent aminotransferase [Salinivirga sp.]|uniref:pyridoxal phosphate-dependent aminotransferase n=1 Tax=Salinivirga sp. TaxID=1970192 RepID=UPI002B472203|nr:pyridoxal phosphate-dependent aminotransferase [Salinivirga sp.]HKK59256.1 pyridoxal phosphate-dependent aminotransferase [Salinivirga sp.]
MSTSKYTMPQGSLISYMSNKVKTYGGINFAQGIPGYNPPEALLQHLESIAHAEIHQYAPGIGNLKLRKLILEHYKDFQFDDDQLLVLQGATEALSLVFQYIKNSLDQPFAAMAFDPVYESYRHLPRIMNIPFHAYAHKQFDTDHLLNFIKDHNIRVMFVNSPGNPFGAVFTEQQMNELRRICDSHGVYMIIDAVYSNLYYEKPPHYPIKNLSPQIFYINSFSKMLSVTGWRIGYLISHPSHTEGLRDIHDYIGLCTNAPLQQALANYLEQKHYGETYVNWLRETLKSAYKRMEKSLLKLNFDIPKANGGYYVWAKLPQNKDGFEFTMELYDEAEVAVIPGIHFSENAHDFIRFNIARPENELLEGIKRIEEFCAKRDL